MGSFWGSSSGAKPGGSADANSGSGPYHAPAQEVNLPPVSHLTTTGNKRRAEESPDGFGWGLQSPSSKFLKTSFLSPEPEDTVRLFASSVHSSLLTTLKLISNYVILCIS